MKRSFDSVAAGESQEEGPGAPGCGKSGESSEPGQASVAEENPGGDAAGKEEVSVQLKFTCRLILGSKQTYVLCKQELKWPLLVSVTASQTKHHRDVLRRILRRMNPDYDATKPGVFHCSLPFRSFEALKAKVTEKKKLWLEHLLEAKERGQEVAVWPENFSGPEKLLHED